MDTNTIVLFSSEGVKNRRAAPLKDYSFFHHYCYLCYYCSYVFYFYYYYYYKIISKEDNNNLLLQSSPPLNACPHNYNDPLIYKEGGSWQFSPKPLVVIFFRAPGGHGIYKKPLKLIQRPINSYIGCPFPQHLVLIKKRQQS
jgi:hypothetical protein